MKKLKKRLTIGAKNVGLALRAASGMEQLLIMTAIITVITSITLAVLAAFLLAECLSGTTQPIRMIATQLSHGSSISLDFVTVDTVVYDWLGIMTYTMTMVVGWLLTMLVLALLLRGYRALLERAWRDLPACDELSHGGTLAQVMFNLHGESVEYDAVFLPDGTKVGEWTNFSTNGVVHMLPALDSKVYCIVGVHNHPGDDSAPSAIDFASMIEDQEWCSILVTQRKIFVLLATPSCWELNPDAVREKYCQIQASLLNRWQDSDDVAIHTAAMETAALFGFHLSEHPFSRRNCMQLAEEILSGGKDLFRQSQIKQQRASEAAS